jgi:membrane associated rhomboid family serine protease
VINTVIIGLNVVAFLFETRVDPRALDNLLYGFGLVPDGFWTGGIARWLTLFTSMFLHGSWFHVISNMMALYIFGDNVEDRLGHARYLLFYVLGGVLAGAAHIVAYPQSRLPTVGASGAIAAVLGAYLILYPRARVITLIPILFFWRVVNIPAPVYLGLWFVLQLFSGTLALAAATFQGGGVAWWAHIGGFVAGIALVKVFEPRRRRREYLDEAYPW